MRYAVLVEHLRAHDPGKGVISQENNSAVMSAVIDAGVQITENDSVRDEKGKEA